MHRYLRAIGFSKINKREELQELINEVVEKALLHSEQTKQKKHKKEAEYISSRNIAADEDNRVFAELFLEYVHGAGICVRGEFDEDNNFLFEYYFPYLNGNCISSNEDVTVERHAEKESYAGVCEDIKVGVSLIFYLQNMVPYKHLKALNQLPVQDTSVVLSALSVEGTIMMPINKNEYDKQRIKKVSSERNRLIAQARRGDDDAIETLTLDDMDTYTIISKKIHDDDLFTLVDTYFMPYGVECDQYSIMGEIMRMHIDRNRVTDEEIVVMTIECNDLLLEVCINRADLYGEAAVGRRFKGVVWLQGFIVFPEEII